MGVNPFARSSAVAARTPSPPCSCWVNAGSGAERLGVAAAPPFCGTDVVWDGCDVAPVDGCAGCVCGVAGAPATDTVFVPEPHAASARLSAAMLAVAGRVVAVLMAMMVFAATRRAPH